MQLGETATLNKSTGVVTYKGIEMQRDELEMLLGMYQFAGKIEQHDTESYGLMQEYTEQ